MPAPTSTSDEAHITNRQPRLSTSRKLSLLFVAGAAAMVWGWGLTASLFRDAEGYLTAAFIVPVATGMGVLLIGMAPRPWRPAAAWAALAMIGQAVMLQLVDAGPALHYEHYEVGALWTTHPWLMGFIVGQATLVFMALAKRWEAIRRWLAATFSRWQFAGLSALFVLSSATLSREVLTYGLELAFASFVQFVMLANVVLVAWALPSGKLAAAGSRLQTWWRSWEETERPGLRPERFAVGIALGVTVAAALLNVLAYEQHPHVPDEVTYLRHAQYLAEGMLRMDVPPIPEAFELYLMDTSDRGWFVVSPHGWPLVLALGWLVGAPWLINPLLAGLNVLLASLLLGALYDRRTAQLGTLLLGLSPWYLFLGMSFMNHMSSLAFALLAALSVVQARRTGAVWWTWAGGLALGMLALLRPLEALTVAGLLGLWMLGLGGARLRVSQMAGLVLGSLLVALTLLPYNAALTGDPLRFPINIYTDAHFHPNANAIGFGPDRGTGWALDPYPGHGLRDVLVNTNLNLTTLNTELFGWALGSLLLLGLALFSGRLRRPDRLMLATIGATFAALSCYYFSGGPDFGPRYWFLMVIPCVALTARGIGILMDLLREAAVPDAQWRVGTGLVLLCIMALGIFVPWRAVDKYHHFRGMRPEVRHLAAEHDFGRSLVLIRGREHPDYSSAAVYNPVDLDDAVPVYAWDRGPEVREALRTAFPDRPVWILEGPTLTGAGYRILSSPDKQEVPEEIP